MAGCGQSLVSTIVCCWMCVDTMYQTFVDNPRMTRIRERTVWIHVDVPGQGYNVPDLPPEYVVSVSSHHVISSHLISYELNWIGQNSDQMG